MKPEVDRWLEVTAIHLVLQIAPALPASYQQSGVQTLAAMHMALREEFERAAQRRVEENTALRDLFRDAAARIDDAALATRLAAAGGESDGDLRVSALERSNARLRGLLIELHAHVEALDSEAARRIDASIWAELAASTERRRLSLAVF